MANDDKSANISEMALTFSLVCLYLDGYLRFDEFSTCQRPLQEWLMRSYVLVVTSRLAACLLKAASPPSGEEENVLLLNLRPRGHVAKVLTIATWITNLPLTFCWAVRGSFLLWCTWQRIPECLSDAALQVTYAVVWQSLSYVWVVMHIRVACVAWTFERQLRFHESELRHTQADHNTSRWSEISVSSVNPMSGDRCILAGLSSADILQLPCETYATTPVKDDLCSICVDTFAANDYVRHLECGHTFHRECIDLWLLRRAECPLCKGKVLGVSCRPCEP